MPNEEMRLNLREGRRREGKGSEGRGGKERGYVIC